MASVVRAKLAGHEMPEPFPVSNFFILVVNLEILLVVADVENVAVVFGSKLTCTLL